MFTFHHIDVRHKDRTVDVYPALCLTVLLSNPPLVHWLQQPNCVWWLTSGECELSWAQSPLTPMDLSPARAPVAQQGESPPPISLPPQDEPGHTGSIPETPQRRSRGDVTKAPSRGAHYSATPKTGVLFIHLHPAVQAVRPHRHTKRPLQAPGCQTQRPTQEE
ncbi:hypothetical protein SKAU_G00356260 [Synaphobranchus kaupii]|uniref:Uncharacterized protein n=1 Tax=Synaphobranchus kaupii TaxID=118154 RepID=A0A9Q1EHE3_SYNKA|nr:hypothetical protein SKAU_G00356260 [Synaphobranchus kaupii]